MATIMIKCPKTGRDIPTGFSMDAENFATAVMSGNAIQCPVCHQMHTWDKKDAWLEE